VSIAENYKNLIERIKRAADTAGRDPRTIEIVAVAKTVPVERIVEALNCGITVIGENRVQEAKRKHAVLGTKAEWHMVGHLQTNKVNDALSLFSLIHSLDSRHLAQAIDKRADRTVDCLIEVNTSGETTKYGVKPEELGNFIESLHDLKRIHLRGLMTIGPGWAIEDAENSRLCFRMLRELRDTVSEKYRQDFPILSMGMTSDFEVAIEEGSTMIRVGTALFGPRVKHGG
jgi:pyridoxal phosphate enzyme (YggS family)